MVWAHLFLPETHRLFHSHGKLGIEGIEGFIRWEIEAVEAITVTLALAVSRRPP